MINPVYYSNPYNRLIVGVRVEKPSLSVDKLGFSLINPVDQQFTHLACHKLISVKFVFQVEQQKCIKTRLRVLMLLTSSMVDIILPDTC